MVLAHIDSTGKIVGFYDPEYHENIPVETIEIDQDNWLAHCAGNRKQWNGKNWVDEPPQTVDPVTIAQRELEKSDRDFIRVLEDVITVLGIENDLPAAAKAKLVRREALRQQATK